MKVLLFGATGQVGCALIALASRDVSFDIVGRDAADLTDPAACAERIHETRADVVINAAAWTAVDAAEDAAEAVGVINELAPIAMAQACAARGLPFVHLSSDYVLEGTGDDAQSETTPLGALSVYGRTKAAAETGIRDTMQAAGSVYAILRTSWVFSDTGNNFVRTMLRLSDTRPDLRIVGDQVGGPTPASAIAQACVTVAAALVAGTSRGGLYNFSGAPDVSWADFARAILDTAGRDTPITSIATADYPTRAPRPPNSRLDCTRIRDEFGIERPRWHHDLSTIVPTLTISTDYTT